MKETKRLREGGFLITRIHQLAGRLFAKKLKKYNLDEINPAQGRILFVLWRKDGLSIRELAGKTSLSKSTLTSMLDRLEVTGYIERTPSVSDRRKILIKLSEKDRKLRNIYKKVSKEMTLLFYDGFSAGEISKFEKYLKKILENLTAFERETKHNCQKRAEFKRLLQKEH